MGHNFRAKTGVGFVPRSRQALYPILPMLMQRRGWPVLSRATSTRIGATRLLPLLDRDPRTPQAQSPTASGRGAVLPVRVI